MPYELGDVVLIAFPFTDQVGQKQRPAVIVSSPAYNTRRPDLIAMAITSQLRGKHEFAEVVIDGWQEAGLLKRSAIKPVIFTVEQQLVRRRLGKLSAHDRAALKEALDLVIGTS